MYAQQSGRLTTRSSGQSQARVRVVRSTQTFGLLALGGYMKMILYACVIVGSIGSLMTPRLARCESPLQEPVISNVESGHMAAIAAHNADVELNRIYNDVIVHIR